MTRISKDPAVRRQELIDVAERLFLEKGYEAVSVRDILKEVNGAPGMFYYYFESKQEIYKAAILQLVDRLGKKEAQILMNRSLPIANRLKNIIEFIQENYQKFYSTFHIEENAAYEAVILLQILNHMTDPIADTILEAKEKGLISEDVDINSANARQTAIFLLHGVYGLIHDISEKDVSEEQNPSNLLYVIPMVCQFLHISMEKLMEGDK